MPEVLEQPIVDELTVEDLAQVDSGYWAELNCLKLQTGKFSFKDHEYQIEPMASTAKRKCVMKGTQAGFTEIEVIDSLHGMRYGHLPQGVLYLFPTADDVSDFAKSRFNPMLASNREAIGRFVKSGGKGTDSAGLKKVGKTAFLYLRGARLSQKVSDVNESAKLKSIPVDRVVFDEVDHMDEEVITKAISRMGHSKVQQERYLSNPVVPGEGVDKIFTNSDQREWFRKCSSCGKTPPAGADHGWFEDKNNGWTCAELFFMEDAEKCVGTRTNGTGYIACQKCGKEVFIRDGRWVPLMPCNTNYMHGYHWSQLTSVYNDPLDILHHFRNPPHDNLADVYRLRLGLPYIAAEDRLTKSEVLDCCSMFPMKYGHDGPCAMGVDVGKIKHIVIGPKIGNDQYSIVKMARLSKWEDILSLALKFNVKQAVVDIRPYEDSAREFQKNAKKVGIKVFLCEYKENAVSDYVYNENSGIVAANRTQVFDATHRLVTTQGQLTIPRVDEEVLEYTKQMCGAFKICEVNKKTGTSVYRYKGKNEHYRNAQNYHYLAARQKTLAKSGPRGVNKNRQTNASLR